MQLIIFFITAFVGFAGGAIILTRSLNQPGHTVAAGLFCLALWQVGAVAFIHWHTPIGLHVCLLSELAAVSFLITTLLTIEGHLAKQIVLVRRIKLALSAICLLYGVTLLLFPTLQVRNSSIGFTLDVLGLGQSFLLLVGVIGCLWITENVLRAASDEQRRILMYPGLGIIAINGALLAGAIYRIGTHAISEDILILESLIMLVGILLVVFFSIRHRLFAVDILVSRYAIYHSITFLSVGIYLCMSGLIIYGMHRLGLSASFVMTGFLAFCAVIILLLMIVSPTLRARVRFFINTHFFVNKYDYRKEWGEMSRYLGVATNASQIIHTTAQVILDSMFIRELSIWLRDEEEHVFTCALAFPCAPVLDRVAPDDPFLIYLGTRPFLRSVPMVLGDRLWERIVTADATFVEANKIEMAVPMTSEGAMIGFIAVGRENPGSRYGADDIDLLTDIAAQCGAALMQAQFAQQLAENKEVDTYNYLSATLLHDLKNAAGHLSLILQNAPKHIDQKDFQQDMIETITQALARIDKVISKLGRLPGKVEIAHKPVHVEPFVQSLVNKLKPRLATVQLIQHMEDGLELNTDPEMLERMLENLIINASEAVSPQGEITITAARARLGGGIAISVADDGPGLTEEFVKKRLFKPFQTTKPTGTGIGLWHVKNMAQQVGARITVDNRRARGVVFTLVFPDEATKNEDQNKDM
ncbi:MAG: XrtA/PEP-CTERM system histidine kinase PrsK [Syntrophaceae bacterium]